MTAPAQVTGDIGLDIGQGDDHRARRQSLIEPQARLADIKRELMTIDSGRQDLDQGRVRAFLPAQQAHTSPHSVVNAAAVIAGQVPGIEPRQAMPKRRFAADRPGAEGAVLGLPPLHQPDLGEMRAGAVIVGYEEDAVDIDDPPAISAT